ncbi:MAG: Abi family protein [Anaerolineae bacterium]|nr:Abi family protein [Anaerolineae bacterium]
MKYTKPALTFEKQADLLLARGLVADRAQLIHRLGITSYFRLSTYLYHFRVAGTDNFQPGTTLESVLQIYKFDQRLRTLMLDAIEGIEVYTRTQLAYHFANDFGPFAYTEASNFPNLQSHQFFEWQRKLDDQVQRSHRSREEFVTHFFNKYGDEHTRLPVWMLAELMDFGTTLTFFRGVNDNPALPNNRMGIALTICRYWQNQISSTNGWTQRIVNLFDEFTLVDPVRMGLPIDWRNHPLWRTP